MAQKVNIVLVDDMDGSEAVETVTFGLDGDQYEIDLNTDNATILRDALRPFMETGRVVQRRRGRKPAALVEAQARTTKKATTGTKRGGTRKRTASIEEIEASKVK
jgi:hypothetical protein